MDRLRHINPNRKTHTHTHTQRGRDKKHPEADKKTDAKTYKKT